MTKTGQDHLDSLRDGRSVYLDGQLVGDVRKLYLVNRVYDDILVSFAESVLPSYLDVQPLPNANATGNNTCSYRLMKSSCELHRP